MLINKDCRFFKGDIPCIYHKNTGVHCFNCKFYKPIDKKILIIKLGAAGDVIRTTPLLHKIKQTYPNSEITWLTYSPELVPSIVDNILNFEFKNVLYLINTSFDIVINLDKDKEACALINIISTKSKKGFKLENGKVVPVNKDAEHKWVTGLFDDVNSSNTKSYPEEIFEVCGFKFNGEKYILDKPDEGVNIYINEPRPLIGLNTGCGDRWTTRLWDINNWISLAKILKNNNYGVILLGGKNEHKKNKEISEISGAKYSGYFSIREFISLVNKCNLIVTTVTMALHIAIGLEKKIVLLNNIFNRSEFELYGLGEIIEPDIECLGCFKNKCEINCMDLISPKVIFNKVRKLIKQ